MVDGEVVVVVVVVEVVVVLVVAVVVVAEVAAADLKGYLVELRTRCTTMNGLLDALEAVSSTIFIYIQTETDKLCIATMRRQLSSKRTT